MDAPYFGCSASASFEIPMWVRVEELTTEERAKFDKEEEEREVQRVVWRKVLTRKREEEPASKKDSKEDGEENERTSDTVDEEEEINRENAKHVQKQEEREAIEEIERRPEGAEKKNAIAAVGDVAVRECLAPKSSQTLKQEQPEIAEKASKEVEVIQVGELSSGKKDRSVDTTGTNAEVDTAKSNKLSIGSAPQVGKEDPEGLVTKRQIDDGCWAESVNANLRNVNTTDAEEVTGKADSVQTSSQQDSGQGSEDLEEGELINLGD